MSEQTAGFGSVETAEQALHRATDAEIPKESSYADDQIAGHLHRGGLVSSALEARRIGSAWVDCGMGYHDFMEWLQVPCLDPEIARDCSRAGLTARSVKGLLALLKRATETRLEQQLQTIGAAFEEQGARLERLEALEERLRTQTKAKPKA